MNPSSLSRFHTLPTAVISNRFCHRIRVVFDSFHPVDEVMFGRGWHVC